MDLFVTIVHVVTCLLLILVVLVQSGKGAEISASFGGSSNTVFGSSGGANFFTRLTGTLAAVFMLTSITLTWLSKHSNRSVFEGAPVTETATPPADTAKDEMAKPGENAPPTGKETSKTE